jgi:hypothetical protein
MKEVNLKLKLTLEKLVGLGRYHYNIDMEMVMYFVMDLQPKIKQYKN